jgi:hypothetical protein
MLITKVKPGIYMSAWMLVWAVVSGKSIPARSSLAAWHKISNPIPGCTALVKNYQGLLVCRFFLGITEAPVSAQLFDAAICY